MTQIRSFLPSMETRFIGKSFFIQSSCDVSFQFKIGNTIVWYFYWSMNACFSATMSWTGISLDDWLHRIHFNRIVGCYTWCWLLYVMFLKPPNPKSRSSQHSVMQEHLEMSICSTKGEYHEIKSSKNWTLML